MTCTQPVMNLLLTDKKFKNWVAEQKSLALKCTQNNIDLVNKNIGNMNKCITTGITSGLTTTTPTTTTVTSFLASTIGNLQQTIFQIEDDIDNKREELLISEERVKRMTEPEKNVSFYESWFPMDKPLKMESVPILIGFSILFFTIFAGIILTALRINLGFSKEPIELKMADFSRTKISDFFKLFR